MKRAVLALALLLAASQAWGATYYVSGSSGSDSDDGLSYANAWLTLGKALGAAGIASGDVLEVESGTYREVVTVAMTSATAETIVRCDVDGSATGIPGECVWTAFTTNDTTAPSTSSLITLAGRDHLTFESFTMVGGDNTTGTVVDANTATSTHVTLRVCVLFGSSVVNGRQRLVYVAGATDGSAGALDWLIEDCKFFAGASSTGTQGVLQLVPGLHTDTDFDIAFTVRNCLFVSGDEVRAILGPSPGGAGTGKPGGLVVQNCTFWGMGTALQTSNANWSTSIPWSVTGSLITATIGMNANASGQIVESYNRIRAPTPRNNVSAGTGSVADGSQYVGVEVGQAELHGGTIRPFLSPTAGSPLLGFVASGSPSTDILGLPRPSGGQVTAAVGAHERGNTVVTDDSFGKTSAPSWKFTGPGVQDFEIPVNAAATTITLWTYWDTTYAGTKPSVHLINCTEAGVSDASDTATGSAETWEELTLAFTPTSAGRCTLRMRSSTTDAAGEAWFDDYGAAE